MKLFDGLPGIFTATFGQTVTIATDGGPVTLTAILRRPAAGDLYDPGAVVREAELHARAEDLSAVDTGDVVTAGGMEFEIMSMQPDDRGMVAMPLRLK